jgi:myo-inositol-1(or 4)-monophosphatase
MSQPRNSDWDVGLALRAALAAADAATTELLARFRPSGEAALDIQVKGPGALVTDADMAADRAIADALIGLNAPGDILSEESQQDRGDTDLTWLIDPLCGTTPFSTGLGQWGVNVALRSQTGLELGVVAIPTLREMLSAVRGKGVSRNGQPWTVTEPPGEMGDIAIGIEIDSGPDWAERMAGDLRWLKANGQVYSFVSAAYPAAQVILGRMHGVVFHRITPVHLAASAAVAGELGIRVTGPSGEELDWADDEGFDRVIFAWPRTHSALLQAIAAS